MSVKPLRAEHVGSRHRPQALRDARTRLLGGLRREAGFGKHNNSGLRSDIFRVHIARCRSGDARPSFAGAKMWRRYLAGEARGQNVHHPAAHIAVVFPRKAFCFDAFSGAER